jgi:hypothetical protein
MLGQALAYAPNVNAAIVSASRIKKVLERIPKFNNPIATAGRNYEVSLMHKSQFFLSLTISKIAA